MAWEMKDSGIEWIGKIPKEYRIYRLKCLLRKPLDYGANSSGVEYLDNLPRYIRITDIAADGKLKNDDALSIELEDTSPYLLEDGIYYLLEVVLLLERVLFIMQSMEGRLLQDI